MSHKIKGQIGQLYMGIPNVVGGGNGTGDGGFALLSAVLDALASEVGGSALRSLDDDGRLRVPGGLEGGGGGGRGGHVDSRHGEAVGLGVGEQLQHIVTVDDTRLEAEFFHKTRHCGQNDVQKSLISRKEVLVKRCREGRTIQCLIKVPEALLVRGLWRRTLS